METATPARREPTIRADELASACGEASEAIASAAGAEAAIDAAVAVLHERLGSIFVSTFVLEHDRLWIISQRGYTMIPEGLTVHEGVMGRSVREARAQLVLDVADDPEFVVTARGIVSELAVPLAGHDGVVGVLNIETLVRLPEGADRIVTPLAAALAPVMNEVRTARSLDLSALARLFVYVSSLRDPVAIADIAAASLARVLPVETSQVSLFDESGAAGELAVWRATESSPLPLSSAALAEIRAGVDPTAVFELLGVGGGYAITGDGAAARAVVWLPLRANNVEFGVLVGTSRWTKEYDRGQAEVAALLAAHAAASLDAALSLGRERQSALTDPLTGLLNRRGFEGRLDAELAAAQAERRPLSLLVLDFDDFKDVNDRAGHEFGDALLRETAHVLVGILPADASAARLGGDEFVVMLPSTDADAAESIGNELRRRLCDGLADAGFPLHLSAGATTYPFDGANGSQLLRVADQALYRAKETGKNRVVSFSEIGRGAVVSDEPVTGKRERRRSPTRADTTVLGDIGEAATAIWAETTVDGVLQRLCKALTFVVGATGCVASRVDGVYIIDAAKHTLRELSLGDETAYLIADFPLTREVLETGETRCVSFLDPDVDRAEAFVLRDLKMNCVLLMPVLVSGDAWGLVELYDIRLRRFTPADQAVAEFLVGQAAHRLETLADVTRHAVDALPPIFRLPPADEELPPRDDAA